MKYFNQKDIQKLVSSVIRIGDELLRQWNAVDEIVFKKDHTLLTASDLYADRQLKEILPGFINLPVHSEEDDDGSMEPDCWLIDPIDGTAAFVAGIPTWAVSVSLILGGDVRFGLIHFPVIQKTVHSEMADPNLKFSKIGKSFHPEDFICVPSNVHTRYDITFPGKVRSLGSCASQIYYAITGRACFSLLGFPKPWDFAAGVPLIRMAGGDIFDLNGESIDFKTLWLGQSQMRMPIIIAHRESVKDIIGMIKLK